MEQSVWKKNVKERQFKSLTGDLKTEVVIIGGGMAGILCAFALKEAGVSCVLIEASEIASGITGNTTAKITYQHGFIYSKLIKEFGTERAKMYLEANKAALAAYKNLAEKMKFDFEEKTAYTYTMHSLEKAEKEAEAINILGGSAEILDNIDLPFSVCGAVGVHSQAQFNPLKFISAISENLPIFEHTCALEITKGEVVTKQGKIKADKIIVASHFPFINKHGLYFLKLYQHRSYVCAFEKAEIPHGMYVDEDLKGLSFRNYGNLLLIGGGGHRTGKKGGGWAEIERFAGTYYPHAEVKYRWATQDCMSLDGVPYIGQYSKTTPGLYVATGFNKWGMTSSMIASKILCDMVLGRKNDFAEVFSPSRNILKPQLSINAFETTKNMLIPTVPRCPHLGCALKWNIQEHSWDCSCHGSRFNKEGKLIDNPATGDAKVK